jgi:hypothetical protein
VGVGVGWIICRSLLMKLDPQRRQGCAALRHKSVTNLPKHPQQLKCQTEGKRKHLSEYFRNLFCEIIDIDNVVIHNVNIIITTN